VAHPSRQIVLAARPHGEPTPAEFRLEDAELPDPGPGEVLVRNRWMSVDPYMRGRMNDARSYVPPFQVGAPLDGGAVGEVVASGDPGVPEGSTVLHGLGWRELALVPAKRVQPVDPQAAPAQAYLGALGMPGLTAYVGLLDIAGLREGDVVFVSGAAGAVGSLAGQIAKARGHTVIGSAGSAEKVALLREELGFDAAFNYKDGRVRDLLRRPPPTGSTSTSTTWAGSTWKPRSAACACTGASRCAGRSPPTTRRRRSPGRTTSTRRSASG
jgi:NADPH-dependent curcumin reductase CurA